ncbi:type ISP restriction/modification enzyme [Janthinobacterium sp. SUN137]|uniref:DEAD/DEAH box helicase n=1 Tax=Janthinobacterium sp. SUN137 TaxID=3014789 RepID=UPI002713F54A|nr:type ISP restriction/modification enzyme [Janthinobacterium sp. SUN137]MDO8039566.1 DEAD/DEAH box helicase family protein [Janthinobacterium sp. SUN137]
MIRTILQQYRDQSAFNRDLGDRFERLMRAYLKLDPQYVALFSDVWMWKDWPHREVLGYKAPDTGIDLVAKLREGEGYCAIQCKFYDSPIPLGDLGNFFTLSGKGGFTQRMIMATANLSKHAADALENQTIPVELMTLEDLDAAPIDWSQFSLDQPDQLRKLPKKEPREHQSDALFNVTKGFKTSNRGKLIMACGTGKTYTSLIVAQEMVKPGQHILFLVPSIALLSQTLRAWTADASVPLRCFAVCSDSAVSRNEEDIRIYELAYPATTNATKLARSLTETQDSTAVTVIFSTYQSIDVVHQAQQKTGIEFELVVCDEAHRTAGYTAPGEDHSAFLRVHDNDYIKGKNRLYMTATPRIYAEASKNKAEESDVQVFSMDDDTTFGPVFHRLRFDEAVKLDLLSDYKVLVIAVDELHVSQVLNQRIADSGDGLKLDDAVKIVGCWNGLGKHVAAEDGMDISADPKAMRTAIAFAQSIRHSKLLTAEFERVSNDLGDEIDYLPALEAKHVDGTMNVVERNQKLSWLKGNIGTDEPVCRIVTNARCLSEGVDVPALDAVIFLNPRDSVVDVVQSVGRVMRKDPAGRKKYGYVILPIGIRKDTSPETALNDNKKYRVVWQVLNALRAHDDRLDKQFATIDLTGKANGIVNVIGVGGGNDKTDRVPDQLGFAFDPIELGKWQDAMFAKIVNKCGNRRYWEDWAKDIAEIADRHQMRIRALLDKPHSKGKKAFDEFLKGVRKNLNPSVSQNDAIEMLAQHIITKPVFDALFEGYAFTSKNPVSQSMQKIMDILEAQALDKEHETLQGFYASVRERASGITDPKGRQKIIVELYERFFKTAFPRMVERLGIVYTPIPVVDFILRSADAALQEHFGYRLADQNVHILDPFTGTGTFPVRLIETGLIPADKLAYKYRHELHANEIVLLAYYIAAINIEESFHRVTGQDYEPFPGIVLTDTFQMNEPQTGDLDEGLPENHERADQQKERDIHVIVGNPPYSVGQDDTGENNQNLSYPKLDGRIGATYAAHSSSTNKNSLYDSYIRAFRWAADRIKEEGVVCFVTNGGWIDGNTMDGFRRSLRDEFSDVYVFNLRGNARTQGELRRKEAGNVFDAGSRTPVAITLLVKRKGYSGPATIRYHDIGDYLSREQKLEIITGLGNHQSVPWQIIEPNEHHDWINQRSGDFGSFVPLNDAPDAIFMLRSSGVQTNRDNWAYNASPTVLAQSMERMIDFYNNQLVLHRNAVQIEGSSKDKEKVAGQLIDASPNKIKWTRSLIAHLVRGRVGVFDKEKLGKVAYRPYCQSWIYYDPQFNEYYKEKLYPKPVPKNLAIQATGSGGNKDFSCIISNLIFDVQTLSNGQCFPLYWYEKADGKQRQSGFEFEQGSKDNEIDGYIRRDGISSAALENFRKHYSDQSIEKEDIFYYVYGVLHSPEYREQYSSDLKKVLPRVPFAPNFQAFQNAGRSLAALHLNYESVEEWPVVEDAKEKGDLNDFAYYRVDKMRFASKGGREKERSIIVFNSRITLKEIPDEAYEYVVNGKSAVEWVMEHYQDYTDKDNGIRNDANDWCRENNDPAYILKLIKRVIRVSVETMKIIETLPSIV